MQFFNPFIGISCDSGESNFYRSPQTLSHAIQKTGGSPILLPDCLSKNSLKNLIQRLDGLIIAGGAFDIPPSFYREKAKYRIDNPQKKRTELELELIKTGYHLKKNILGICGGMQAINVALGGSLYQDIKSQLPYVGCHEQSEPKEQTTHWVNLCQGTQLAQWFGIGRLKTNSTHHQAVKELGDQLIANAWSDDGVVEGLESEDGLLIGVQWHPECLKDVKNRQFLRSFVKKCKGTNRR